MQAKLDLFACWGTMLNFLITFFPYCREFNDRLKILETQNLMLLERIELLEQAHQDIRNRAILERQQVQGAVGDLTSQVSNLELQVQELKDLLSLEDQEVVQAVAALDAQLVNLQGIAAEISAIYEDAPEIPEAPDSSEAPEKV